MTTIDNIMALADKYASQWESSYEYPTTTREALRTALTEALAFNPDWADFNNGRECGRIEATEALAAQPVREPVAWMYDIATYIDGDVRGRNWRQAFSTQKPNMPWMTKDVTPLYATPQPVREPLSQGAILAVFSDAETAMRRNPNLSWRYAIIDEVERAHGIGVDK